MSSTPGTLSSSSSSSSISSAFSSPASSISAKPYQPKGIPVLESLSLTSCNVGDREFGDFLQKIPGLRELCINDCKSLNRNVTSSILTYTPELESLSLSSVPLLSPESLVELFIVTEARSESGAMEIPGENPHKSGLQLKNVRLAYLRQLDDNIMKTIALHQGPSLVKLSLHWCPHVTDQGIVPIFESCGHLKDLSICLSKPTVSIFSDLIDSNNGTKKNWACSQTLERLEIGGQMFLDRIRASNAHLQPQLYHHTSPNPHHIRNGSTPQFITGGAISGITGTAGGNSSNIIHDPYAVAHHQGYPMYHLWRYNRFSDPFRELQTQLETLPRLKHLGISSKGVEHLIRKGFGPKVHLDSLTLLNQQGRVWDPEEVEDLLKHMPELRNIICEKNTILISSQSAQIRKDAKLYKQQERVVKILQRHNVELVQSS
ncbi:hypothetical protein BGZ76_009492 [Entomortierella beljakovae]|nr:hypothetical protein BGZ76_009492 [Entomortierella beljakovae]